MLTINHPKEWPSYVTFLGRAVCLYDAAGKCARNGFMQLVRPGVFPRVVSVCLSLNGWLFAYIFASLQWPLTLLYPGGRPKQIFKHPGTFVQTLHKVGDSRHSHVLMKNYMLFEKQHVPKQSVEISGDLRSPCPAAQEP